MSSFACPSCGHDAPLSQECPKCESDAEAKRALELANAATYGPWTRDGTFVATTMQCWLAEVANLNGNGVNNAVFIAASRAFVPVLAGQVLALLSRLRATREELADATAKLDREARGEVAIHACPPKGAALTPCCQRTPFELPRTDRITVLPEKVNCDRTRLLAKIENQDNFITTRQPEMDHVRAVELPALSEERDAARRELEELKARLEPSGVSTYRGLFRCAVCKYDAPLVSACPVCKARRESQELHAELVKVRCELADMERQRNEAKQSQEFEFTQGFAAAVAALIRAFDRPSMAIDILTSNGLSLANIEACGAEDFDLEPIRKAWAAEVREPLPEPPKEG